MAFAMAGGTGLKELHQALLYGTMPAIRVTHLLLQTERSYAWKSIPELTRIAVLAHIFCTVVKWILRKK
jgi:hypothetical protein